ncbi:MAG: nitroreductase family protein [Bacillota bacterium]|nr:nitroreductase family protein [Bacillota bacterium]
MELMKLLMKRRSIRKYTDEHIPQEKLDEILKAGLMSFSGRNLKPWEFIVVKDKDMLEKLSHAKDSGSAMLAGADCAIVVIGDREKTDVWTEDCSIAMTYMHLMAAKLDVGSCWVQCRLRNDENGGSTEDYVRNLLGVPENYAVEAMLSLGMPAHEARGHKEADLESDKIHNEVF